MAETIAFNIRKNAEEMKQSIHELNEWTSEMQAKRMSAGMVGASSSTPVPAKNVEASLIEKEKGNAYFQRNAFEKAVACYAKSVTFDPSNATAYSNKAMAHLKLNQFEEAREACSLGLVIDPKNVKMWWRRAIALRELGMLSEAQSDLERAKVLDPVNKSVIQELELVHQMRTPIPEKLEGSKPSTLTSAPPQRRRLVIEEIGTAPLTPPPAPSSSSPSTKSNADWMSALEEITTSIPKSAASPVTKPKATSPIPSPTSSTDLRIPESLLEFELDWKSLKARDPSILTSYLLAIPPNRFNKIFRTGIEGDYLGGAISALASCIREADEIRVVELLAALSLCPRFDMALMFRSRAEKNATTHLFEKLTNKDSGALPDLRKRYKVI